MVIYDNALVIHGNIWLGYTLVFLILWVIYGNARYDYAYPLVLQHGNGKFPVC